MAKARYVLGMEEVTDLTDIYAAMMAFRMGIERAQREALIHNDVTDGIAEQIITTLKDAEEILFDAIEEGDADILLSWVEQSGDGDFEGNWKTSIQHALWDDITG